MLPPRVTERMVGPRGGLEGGLALQTSTVWFKRPSEACPDLSSLNRSFVLLHCCLHIRVCRISVCHAGRSGCFIRPYAQLRRENVCIRFWVNAYVRKLVPD